MLTSEAAQHMQSTGEYYTAAKLADEINTSQKEARVLMRNIRDSANFETDSTPKPDSKLKVIAVSESKSVDLWGLAMGHRKVA